MEDREAFSAAREAARKALQLERARYIQERWAAGGPGAMSRRWKLFNQLSGRKAPSRAEPSCSPDAMNRCFLEKTARLREALKGAALPSLTPLEER